MPADVRGEHSHGLIDDENVVVLEDDGDIAGDAAGAIVGLAGAVSSWAIAAVAHG
jgi:hypothetical protein